MCTVCGCNEGAPASDAPARARPADLHFGAGVARVSVPGMSEARTIKLEADILGANNRIASQNRAQFAAHGVTALNLLSSPGSGKTTLLCATIEALKHGFPDTAVAVIEGDQETQIDADRVRATGAPAIQVNTGKGCHLDAPMVARAFAELHPLAFHDRDGAGRGHSHSHSHSHSHGHIHGHIHGHRRSHGHVHDHGQDYTYDSDHGHGHGHDQPSPPARGVRPTLLFIENVGNLVCPALWDLGETAKVVILSVTEGDDKPLKYPDTFAASKLMILNKIDLLPHVRFDVARCVALARRVNPELQILALSATTGEGMHRWLAWLTRPRLGVLHKDEPEDTLVTAVAERALRARIHALEAELAEARAALAGSPAR